MFRLKLPTDPRWANIAESNLPNILSDHAWCEHKAASNALMLITMLPEHPEIVKQLHEIALEELEHFKQVHQIIIDRGFKLDRPCKDDYVNELMKFITKGGVRNHYIADRMLFAAMIEARSCERFKVLSNKIKDDFLAQFYRELMISEANHYKAFLDFAKQIAPKEFNVKERWEQWLAYEAQIIQNYGTKSEIHG